MCTLGPPSCGLWWVWLTETRTGLLLVPQKPHGMTFIHIAKLLDVILQCPLLPHVRFLCCCHVSPLQWPERVIHCDSAVTSLDFSANNPSQLAVGMQDGSIAIHSVQSQDKNTRVISSRWGLCASIVHHSLTIEQLLELLVAVSFFVSVSAQWISQQTLGSSVAAQVDSTRNELNRRWKGRSSLLYSCRWQD